MMNYYLILFLLFSWAFCQSKGDDLNATLVHSLEKQLNRFTCPTLQPPTNGRLECDNYYDPYQCTFHCQPGYRLEGSSQVYCENGQWRPYNYQSVCVRIDSQIIGGSGNGLTAYEVCPPLRNPVYGYIEGSCGPNPNVGDTCYFYCERGYILQGNSVLKCRSDGLWTSQPPLCGRSTGNGGSIGGVITGGDLNGNNGFVGGNGVNSRYCQDLEYVEGVSFTGTCRSARIGDRCYMRCTEYVSSQRPAEVVSVCGENGWSHQVPRCRAGIIGSILGEIISKIIPAASDKENLTSVFTS